jgi:hypothetical protein
MQGAAAPSVGAEGHGAVVRRRRVMARLVCASVARTMHVRGIQYWTCRHATDIRKIAVTGSLLLKSPPQISPPTTQRFLRGKGGTPLGFCDRFGRNPVPGSPSTPPRTFAHLHFSPRPDFIRTSNRPRPDNVWTKPHVDVRTSTGRVCVDAALRVEAWRPSHLTPTG